FVPFSCPQFPAHAIPDAVFIGLQKLQQSGYRLAVDLGGFEQGPTRIGNSPDPAMRLVPIGITKVVLHVTDQRVVPVHDIKSSVRPELEGNRSEIAIGRLEEGLNLNSYKA